MRIRSLLPVLLVMQCALRENPYDPLSPLHHAPNLSVEVTFDSSHVLGRLGDSLYAQAPLVLSLNCCAHDFYSSSDTLPVDFSIQYGNRLLSYRNATKESVRLVERGTHTLHFYTQALINTVSERTITAFLDTRERPYFIVFRCTPDTFPLTPSCDNRESARFSVAIDDPSSLLSHAVFNYGNFDAQIKDRCFSPEPATRFPVNITTRSLRPPFLPVIRQLR